MVAKVSVQIRLDLTDVEWLDIEAERMGDSSRGAVIRSLIRDRRDKQPPPASEASCKCC
ncbi:ribbon-helix-helix protein, CopG family [Pyramidobacter piscolens]|uniref:ribbon-helix-helix protein, CopG family n=1 Tax=Pyramidobacter piscolens TaxID=638849 RepID=UPI00332BD5A9